jgi:hypothetical protein
MCSTLPFSSRVLCFFPAVAFAIASASSAELARSDWVHPGDDGKLVYKTTPVGDRIMDFSYAGYMGGGVALPHVPTKVTVKPGGTEDDSDAIEAAIDQVAAMPLENGFRGAVLLAPGVFNCSRPISISASGIVLRGSGSGIGESAPNVTRSTIKLTGRPHPAIVVRSGGPGRGQPSGSGAADGAAAARTIVSDAYVPAGAMTFSVTDAKGFAVGDTIAIQRPVTEAWLKLMQMDDLTRDGRQQTWLGVGTTTIAERRIAAIDGNTLTLDVPLADSFDAKYLNPPGTAVVKMKPLTRLTQVGIEHLHVESPLQEISHSQAHFTALRLNGQDCWARDVLIDETMNSVSVGGRRITLERVIVRRKARHQGASKPAEFAPNASEVLLDRCTVVGDNVWYIATGGGQAGPIVVLNGDFSGNGRAEAHQRWSTGMLYDNCRAPGGGMEMRNRGSMGSGHGWAMGWGVMWNCVAKDYIVQDPPGARNWLIGSVGHSVLSPRPFGSGPMLAGPTEDSPGKPVAPRSLYLTQLAERLGEQALKNIGYASTDPASAKDPGVAPASRRHSEKTAGKDAGVSLGENLAIDRPVLTSNVRGNNREVAGWQALDDDEKTYWATDDGVAPVRLELDTEGALEINAIELGEAAGMTGRVQAYKVEGFTESAWKLLAQGTTIGERAVHRFPSVTVWKVRLTIEKAVPSVALQRFALYSEKR